MKQFFSRLPRKTLAVVAGLVLVVGFATAAKAYWPERPTFTMQHPAPYVTFNSITDNPDYGDERSFFDGKDAANTNSGGFGDTVEVASGETVLLRMYVHNNAGSNLNGANLDGPAVAHNAAARIFLPSASDNALRANAYIDASNANPGEVSDTVDFHGSTQFRLQYVPGSAIMYTNAVPAGFALNDSIVAGGAPIGYTGPNGTIPGCLQYSALITIKVKVLTPSFKLEKMVANPGDKSWSKSVTAQPGATVNFQLAFTNTGAEQLKDVALQDKLPAGLTLVHNSAKLINANTPSTGVNLQNDDLVSNTGTNIGDYDPTANGFLQFKVTVPTEDKLQCGVNNFVNTAVAHVGNQSASDTSTVTVNKTCVNTPTYSCDAFHVSQSGHMVTVDKFEKTAKDGATFKNVVINWGDNSTALTTNNAVGQPHTYSANGPYTLVATAHFSVNGQDKTASGPACTQMVSFTTTPPPTTLVNTGPGDALAVVALTAVGGAVAYNLYARRLVRE